MSERAHIVMRDDTLCEFSFDELCSSEERCLDLDRDGEIPHALCLECILEFCQILIRFNHYLVERCGSKPLKIGELIDR